MPHPMTGQASSPTPATDDAAMADRYKTPEAFNAALTRVLKQTARAGDHDIGELRRTFILQRFLARLFHPGAPGTGSWILKGGTGLLLRVPNTRHTRDIDLHHRGDRSAAIADIRAAADLEIDRFRFEVSQPRTMSGRHPGIQLTLTAYLGAKLWERVPIDLTINTDEPVGVIDQLVPTPVLAIEDLPPLPPVALYPLPAQIADKLVAMFDRYSNQRSTRYHDLADLVTIIMNCDIPAGATVSAITAEATHRAVQIPSPLAVPGPGWRSATRWPRGRRTCLITSTLSM